MTNVIYSLFAAITLLRGISSETVRRGIWIFVCVVAFAQVGQKAIPGVLILLALQAILIAIDRRTPILKFRYFPLLYATTLLLLNDLLHWKIHGFSYMVLASSLDLRGADSLPTAGERAFSLLSFPKVIVGPIAGAREHRPIRRDQAEIFATAFWGICKGFLAVNLWRHYLPAPDWNDLHGPASYLYFGIWNYVNLFLEFSGTCDLIAATFWLFGFDCPLNFSRPYLAAGVSQFWQRWHITLSHWIKDCVYIPMGGSRVRTSRILLNLMVAMLLCGAWHGLAWHYLAWGALQGALLCGERLTDHERRLINGPRWFALACWVSTQFLVTISWILFFAKF